MITIINISDTKFSYNGINYFKNFTPFVTGNKVSIVNTYDACISLTNFPTIYSDISVDGVTYGSVAALQNALLPVLFNRTFTQAGSLTAGYIPKATGSNALGNSLIYDNGTKVSIGTTNATNKFHSMGGVLNVGLDVTYASKFSGNDVLKGVVIGFDDTNNVGHIGAIHNGVAWRNLILNANGGNVGIGTPNIIHDRLHIQNGTAANTIVTIQSWGIEAGGEFAGIRFKSAVTSNNEYGKGFIGFRNNGTGYGRGDLYFCLNNSTDTSNASIFDVKLVINSSGNLGVNTTSPLTALTVSGNLSLFTTNQIRLYNSAKNNWAEMSSPLLGGDTEIDFKLVTKSGIVYVNPTGNVGFGTINPEVKVDIRGSIIVDAFNTGNENGLFFRAGFATNSKYNVSILAYDHSGAGSSPDGISINGYDGVSICTGSNNRNERFRVTETGQVLTGTTTDNYGDGSTFIAYSGGKAATFLTTATSGYTAMVLRRSASQGGLTEHYYGSTYCGGIGITTNTTSYGTSSDYRLKEDLKEIHGLELISKIQVYNYRWKEDKTRAFGVLAHELQEILPYAVTGEKDAQQMQSVDYSKLVPILVASIKELKAEIQILKN